MSLFPPFLKAHHDLPKFLTSDSLPSTHSLSRCELYSLLNEEVYSKWQQVWESSDTDSTIHYFFPLVKDRASFPLYLNFFLLFSVQIFLLPSMPLQRGIPSFSAHTLWLFSLQRPPTCVQSYSWNTCLFSLIHEIRWDGDPALMKEIAIFVASTSASTSSLATSSH